MFHLWHEHIFKCTCSTYHIVQQKYTGSRSLQAPVTVSGNQFNALIQNSQYNTSHRVQSKTLLGGSRTKHDRSCNHWSMFHFKVCQMASKQISGSATDRISISFFGRRLGNGCPWLLADFLCITVLNEKQRDLTRDQRGVTQFPYLPPGCASDCESTRLESSAPLPADGCRLVLHCCSY